MTIMDRSTYPTHTDLLDQVADSTAERDEVRRIFGTAGGRNLNAPQIQRGGLSEADLDAQQRYKRAPFPVSAANHAHRHSRPACSRCDSGLTQCTTPEACERAEAAARKRPRGDAAQRCITGIVILVTAALMVAAIVHGVLIVAGAQP